jgi:hypothetical protein
MPSRSSTYFLALTLFTLIASIAVAQDTPSESRLARLTGRVADSSGHPIMKAEIAVLKTTIRTQSRDDGGFELPSLPSGAVELMVRRVGYSPSKVALDLGAGELRDIRVLLTPVVTTLDSVSVTASAEPVEPATTGRDRRHARGSGTFLSREQIEKTQPRVPTDLFRTVAGVKVTRESGNATVLSTRFGALATCPLQYILDGRDFPLYGQSIDSMIQVAEIESIEVFPGGASMPPQFGGRASTCGIISISTRKGQRPK